MIESRLPLAPWPLTRQLLPRMVEQGGGNWDCPARGRKVGTALRTATAVPSNAVVGYFEARLPG